jgi:signal transduction histidine kinase/ligand-binding sensor domain-containing protein
MSPGSGRRALHLVGLTLAVLAASDGVQAQSNARSTFRQAIDVERLLPQSSVMFVMEDSRGFLWFATREGVARWDGYSMRVWRHDPFNAASLPGNIVRFITEDKDGSIWVVLHNYLDAPAGIARIVGPGLEIMERVDLPALHVGVDRDGTALAITADSVFRFDAARSRFVNPVRRASRRGGGIAGGPMLLSSAVSPDGTVWISDLHDGALESCDLASSLCRSVSASSADGSSGAVVGGRVFVDRDGRVWVGLLDGIGRVTSDRSRFERVDVLPGGTGSFAITQDRAGAIWILSNDGVFELSPGATRATRHRLATLANEPNPAPITIHADRGGTIWVGTVWGLYRRELRRNAFAHIEHDPRDPNSLSEGLVVSLAEDPTTGEIWIGTIGGGLNRWDRKTGAIRRYRYAGTPRSLSNDIVWALGVDSAGSLWAGTSFGLNRYDRATDSFRQFLRDPTARRAGLEPTENVVLDLVADAHGGVWTTCPSCRQSLHRFDSRAGTSTAVDALRETAGYLQIDGDRLWVGSLGGIRQLDLRTMAMTAIADSGGGNLDGVLAFHRGREGSLWVGANSGLFRFDSAGRLRARYTANEGLPGNAVFGILEDERATLWLSTNRGLVSIDTRASTNAVRVYDHTTGIGNVEFNRNAYLRARDGSMFFGGDRGVTWFHPDQVVLNAYKPPVVFTSLQRSTQRGTRVSHHLGSTPVRVAPDEYTFTIEFAALNYVNPHRNQYAVQLVGFDEDWKQQGVTRQTTYTNVPPGSYEFRVRAANDDGVWNEQPAILTVIVEPFFWQTWWFQAGLVAATVALIVAATWYASRNRFRMALQRSEAQAALEAERSRISRDMHDEVGASLTEIAILSEVALRSSGSVPDGDHLRRIGEKSRATVDSIGEIIWAIDPRNDAGDRFVAYLREFTADYLESADLRAVLSFPTASTTVRVTADFRRSVFLILKEAVANAVRHANATEVRATLTLDANTLKLEIADNGIGFEYSANGDRDVGEDGLENMRQRAAALGGRLEIRSARGSGTAIVCEVPLPQVPVHA